MYIIVVIIIIITITIIIIIIRVHITLECAAHYALELKGTLWTWILRVPRDALRKNCLYLRRNLLLSEWAIVPETRTTKSGIVWQNWTQSWGVEGAKGVCKAVITAV